eukprot:5197791-Prymnesium_polylepis.1
MTAPLAPTRCAPMTPPPRYGGGRSVAACPSPWTWPAGRQPGGGSCATAARPSTRRSSSCQTAPR